MDKTIIEAALVPEPTDAQVLAYLKANDAYWAESDMLPIPPAAWRAGTVFEATRASLRAALAAAPSGIPHFHDEQLVRIGVGNLSTTMSARQWFTLQQLES